jgi:hypothetical protein
MASNNARRAAWGVAVIAVALLGGRALADDSMKNDEETVQKHAAVMNKGGTHEEAREATRHATQTSKDTMHKHVAVMSKGGSHEKAREATTEKKGTANIAQKHAKIMGQGGTHEQARDATKNEE